MSAADATAHDRAARLSASFGVAVVFTLELFAAAVQRRAQRRPDKARSIYVGTFFLAAADYVAGH